MNPGRDAREVVGRLAARNIIISEKDGFARASIYAYNNEDDIDTLFQLCADAQAADRHAYRNRLEVFDAAIRVSERGGDRFAPHH